jgi:hypothetical protein
VPLKVALFIIGSASLLLATFAVGFAERVSGPHFLEKIVFVCVAVAAFALVSFWGRQAPVWRGKHVSLMGAAVAFGVAGVFAMPWSQPLLKLLATMVSIVCFGVAALVDGAESGRSASS